MNKGQSQNTQVLNMVYENRIIQPRVGTRKLYTYIKPKLKAKSIKIGRDKLFDILRCADMLVKPRKSKIKTTNSKHRFYKYENLVKNFTPTGPNQLWVADITYIRTMEGTCYLALITDAYSRKIVGSDISNSLELEGALRALKKALRTLPAQGRPIHHSDRGVQYCSYEYTEKLKDYNMPISMAGKGNCYENAMAERINGILKQEFLLDETFLTIKHAQKTTKEAIKIYNKQRLHLGLDYKIPEQVHNLAA